MIKTIRGFMKRLNEDHVGAYAAQSAYFILLSFIPFVLLVVTLVKYTPLRRCLQRSDQYAAHGVPELRGRYCK